VTNGGTSSALTVGFANALHMAGGFGGLRCQGTDFHNSAVGLLIDNAVTAVANREFEQGTGCAFDSMENSGVVINDTLTSGGTVDLAGWEASSREGHGIVVTSWPSGDIEIRGDKIYNNCGSGIYVADTTTHINISPATTINNNGTTLGGNTACTTWQAGAGSGVLGYGIYASSTTANIYGKTDPFGNTVDRFNSNTGLSVNTTFSSSGAQARVNVNQVGGGDSAVFGMQENGTDEYTFGYNPSGNGFSINDKTTGTAVPWLALLAGGNGTLGEALTNNQTVKGNLGFSANAPTLTSCGTGTPTVSAGSSSNGGQITVGTGSPTACTVGFATAFLNNAYCVVSPADTNTETLRVTASSKTAFTVTLSAGTSSAVFNYGCTGN
jgi:hypothetical protein